jgi:site-specific DNA-methyltransferase (adenine-specific)
LNAIVVQRNKGVDGFLKINGEVKPIPIKIQTKNECIEDAQDALLSACKKNKYPIKVLLRTNDRIHGNLFERQREEGLIIVDSYEDVQERMHQVLAMSNAK